MLQGAGLGYRRDLADDFLNLSSNNAIQFMEVASENWVKMGGAARYKFDQAAERYPLAVHGAYVMYYNFVRPHRYNQGLPPVLTKTTYRGLLN